jgi:hypothetical protein
MAFIDGQDVDADDLNNFSPSGNVSIGGTLAVTGAITATAGQIAFPATQSASAGANTLDDYQEGTYTPTWSSGGSAPSLGNGTIAGAFIKIGRTVSVTITLTAGSTTTFGNAANGWTFSVPSGMTAATESVTYIGAVRMADTGTGLYTGVAYIASGGSTISVTPTSGGTSSVTGDVSSTNPFTWANTDVLSLTITYNAAS